jgi:hypothetical protein
VLSLDIDKLTKHKEKENGLSAARITQEDINRRLE